ncbi:hypothetical protein OAO42_01875, partial [Candidatus Izimaplasma bacterium]|nr:hypothetical protein [Candidatus Izimaplasma bacterium]
EIQNNRELRYADCGFAYSNNEPHKVEKGTSHVMLYKDIDYSFIANLSRNGEAIIVGASNNTNLIHSRTRIPTITGKLDIGRNRVITFVSGDSRGVEPLKPHIEIDELHKKCNLYLNEDLVYCFNIE